YSDAWHYAHMDKPADLSPGSIMPAYPWLLENDMRTALMPNKIRTLQKMGVPYPKGYDMQAIDDLEYQAAAIAENLRAGKISGADERKEIIAVIAYLQRLGTDIKKLDNEDNKETVQLVK